VEEKKKLYIVKHSGWYLQFSLHTKIAKDLCNSVSTQVHYTQFVNRPNIWCGKKLKTTKYSKVELALLARRGCSATNCICWKRNVDLCSRMCQIATEM
jgi:hypothetical protein